MDFGSVNVFIALIAGLLSFVSPCVLPLVPAYLAYITGESASGRPGESISQTRRRTVISSVMFVIGMAAVITAFGASASVLGQLLLEYRLLTTKIAGVLIIVFGLSMAGVLRIPFLYREARLDFTLFRNRGYFGAVLMGGAFAIGWTPCVGLVLGSLFLLASQQDTVYQGMSLLFVYSLGLGLPFVLAALAVQGSTTVMRALKANFRKVSMSSGVLLIAMGMLVFSDRLTLITSSLIATFGVGLTQ